MIAALLLGVMSFRGVFLIAVLAFVISAAINSLVTIPQGNNALRGMLERTIYNLRKLFSAPEMRGALILSVASITINASVIVNTIVLVRGLFGLDDRSAAIALAAFGAGGVVAAVPSPRSRISMERQVHHDRGMYSNGCPAFRWHADAIISDAPRAMVLPRGQRHIVSSAVHLLLRRLSAGDDRTGLYAAHYAFDYACLFVAYLLAGWLGGRRLEYGLPWAWRLCCDNRYPRAMVWSPAESDKGKT